MSVRVKIDRHVSHIVIQAADLLVYCNAVVMAQCDVTSPRETATSACKHAAASRRIKRIRGRVRLSDAHAPSSKLRRLLQTLQPPQSPDSAAPVTAGIS